MTACELAVQRAVLQLNRQPETLHLLAAVSGGGDSMALLSALKRQSLVMGYALTVLHVQHGLRGTDSFEDEEFVRDWCKRLHVPLIVRNARLTGDMHSSGIEERARAERYRLFAEEVFRLGCNAVVCAHHADDQAETVLMHLCRGSGIEGLCGMRTVSKMGSLIVLRPFLSLTKRELLNELQAQGIPHREDKSNHELCGVRNRIRLTVMPLLVQMFPGTEISLFRTAENLRSDCDCLEQMAEQFYNEAKTLSVRGIPLLNVEKLKTAPDALLRRCVRRFFEESAAMTGIAADDRVLTQAETLRFCESVKTGSGMNLPCDLKTFFFGKNMLCCRQSGQPLLPPQKSLLLSLSQKSFSWQDVRFTLSKAEEIPRTARSVVLPREMLLQPLMLRVAEEGDSIHPLGAPGSKPLRRYFTDRKVPEPLRRAIPLLCLEKRVLWIPGICTAEELRQNVILPGSISLKAETEEQFSF